MPGPANVNSVFPTGFKPIDYADEAVAAVEAERPGEISLDEIIRAQSLAPQIVKRVTELEDCLWAVADVLVRARKLFWRRAQAEEVDTVIERAKLLLKNRLEIDEEET